MKLMNQEVVWGLEENVELLEAIRREMFYILRNNGVCVTANRCRQDMPVVFVGNAIECGSKPIWSVSVRSCPKLTEVDRS